MRRIIRPMVLGLSFLGCAIFSAAQNTGVVTKNLNLRSEPSAKSQRITTLKPKTKIVLLSATPTNGFYNVRSPQKQEGWVVATGLQLSTGKTQTKRTLVRRPASLELEPRKPGESAAACQPDLTSCPATAVRLPIVLMALQTN